MVISVLILKQTTNYPKKEGKYIKVVLITSSDQPDLDNCS